MKLPLTKTLVMLLFSVVVAFYEEDCFRQTRFYGDVTEPTQSSIVKSDLTKIKALSNPLNYQLSAIVTCIKDGKLLSMRLGVSNDKDSSKHAQHAYWTTTWLTTMGPGSARADYCSEFYLMKNAHVTTLKLYNTPGEGIVGSVWLMDDGTYTVLGQIAGEDRTYTFDRDLQMIGFESIIESGQIASLSVISVYKSLNLCGPAS